MAGIGKFIPLSGMILTSLCAWGAMCTSDQKTKASTTEVQPGSIRWDAGIAMLDSVERDSARWACRQIMQLYGCDWSSDHLNILDCVTQYTGHYLVYVSADTSTMRSRQTRQIRVAIAKGATPLYSWSTYSDGQFLIVDSMLYHTDFYRGGSGMLVVAFDLAAKDTVWTTSLQDIGMLGHSQYWNGGASLTIADKALVVCGIETVGPYVAVLDLTSGRQLAHRRDSLPSN